MTVVGEGVTGAYEGDSIVIKFLITTFLGVAMYNSIELGILVFVTFTEYSGLYFWSMFIAGVVGIIPYSVGFLIKYFNLVNTVYLPLVLLTIGWWIMITGQSFVLYSRLHFVIDNKLVLRRVLFMIIADVFLLHLPTSILTFGSNSPSAAKWTGPYDVMEKIQMTGFCVQEFIISTLYIWETVKMLRKSPRKDSKMIMYQLLSINFLFIVMDISLLACAYAGLYIIETTAKATSYSIKLKLEFAVLGKLVYLAETHRLEFDTGSDDYPDFVDRTRLTTDVTHAPFCENSPPKPPWSQDPPASQDIPLADIQTHAVSRPEDLPALVIPPPDGSQSSSKG